MNKKELKKLFLTHIDEERGDIGRFMDAESTTEKPYKTEKINYNPEIELAPIGTVVATDKTINLKMIIGYNFENPDNNIIYDYIACKYPNGVGRDFNIYYFNHDEIDRYYSIGYTDSKQKKFIEELQSNLKRNYKK